jgi:hypothetical protein
MRGQCLIRGRTEEHWVLPAYAQHDRRVALVALMRDIADRSPMIAAIAYPRRSRGSFAIQGSSLSKSSPAAHGEFSSAGINGNLLETLRLPSSAGIAGTAHAHYDG